MEDNKKTNKEASGDDAGKKEGNPSDSDTKNHLSDVGDLNNDKEELKQFRLIIKDGEGNENILLSESGHSFELVEKGFLSNDKEYFFSSRSKARSFFEGVIKPNIENSKAEIDRISSD